MLVRYVTMGEARAVTVEHLLAEGAKLLKAGHADQAIAVWTEVLHLAPGEPRALGYLKSVGVAANDVEEELLAPGKPPLADIERLLANKQYEQALEVLYAARRDHPEATELARGIQLLKQRLVRRYLRRLGNLDHVPHLLRLDEESMPVSEETRGIVHLVDGISSFGDIARESRLGRFETYRMLARMVDEGVLTAAPAQHAAMAHHPEPAPPPPRRGRGIYYLAAALGVIVLAGSAALLWRWNSAASAPQPVAIAPPTPAPAPAAAAAPTPIPPPSPAPEPEPVATATEGAAPSAPAPEPKVEPAQDTEPMAPPTPGKRPEPRLRGKAKLRVQAQTKVPAPPPMHATDTAAALPPTAPAPEPAKVEAPPVEPPKAEPAPTPPPVEAKPMAPPPKPSGPLDAQVTASVKDVEGALPRAAVERAVERVLPSVRACYVEAAARAQRNAAGTLDVKFSLDETGVARDADVGSGPLPDLAGCVRAAARRIRTQPPDVGGVRVSVTLTFSPVGP